MKRLAAMVVMTIGVAASCMHVTPGVPLTSEPSMPAYSTSMQPPPSASVPPPSFPVLVEQAAPGQAHAEAVARVMELNPSTWCVLESHVEVDPDALGHSTGLVGDLDSAIMALGGAQAIASVTRREVWLIRKVGLDSATAGAPAESWGAFRLAPRTLADGRTAWLLHGDLIAGRPCTS